MAPPSKSVVFTSLASITKEIGQVNMFGRASQKMPSYQMGLSYTIGCQLTNTGHVERIEEVREQGRF